MGAKRGAAWRLNPLAFGNTIFSHRPLSEANTTLLYNLPRSGAPFTFGNTSSLLSAAILYNSL